MNKYVCTICGHIYDEAIEGTRFIYKGLILVKKELLV